jgi:hypothetical protein
VTLVSDEDLPSDLSEFLAWKLAEIGGNNCGRILPDSNRWIGLDIATKYMYSERAENIVSSLLAAGYKVVKVES